jgi:hypothetical protein
MKKELQVGLVILVTFFAGCAVWQSALKSTFPYKTDLTVPKSSSDNTILSVSGTAKSFDQDFSKNGNNADQVSNVRVVSAKIVSDDPSDFDLGNFSKIKVYMSKADGTKEVLVASRTDITPLVGGSLVLDIDNSHALDEQVKEPNVTIRMEYQLHNRIYVNAHLRIVIGVRATP